MLYDSPLGCSVLALGGPTHRCYREACFTSSVSFPPFMSRRTSGIGYRVAQLGAAGAALGGAFDVFVPRLLPHHEAFLGIAPGQASPATTALVLLLLHTLGVALIAVGLGALALLAAWRRTGLGWAALMAAGAVLFAEGANAWAIRRVGSPLFVGPLTCAMFVVVGVTIALRGGGFTAAVSPRVEWRSTT